VFKRKDYGLVGFGRYAGEPWADVPQDYLRWILKDDVDLADSIKAIAKKELAQRNVLDGQLEMF